MAHKLHFEDKTPVLAKDASTKDDDWFEITDPRNAINKRRREASKQLLKHIEKRIRDWIINLGNDWQQNCFVFINFVCK